MDRISRSWRLMKQSYLVLMQDKELMILPVLSGICVLLVSATFVMGAVTFGGEDLLGSDEAAIERSTPDAEIGVGAAEGEEEPSWQLSLVMFGWYVVVYTVGLFFQAAIVAGASERLAGGDPTLRSALGAAFRRIGPIILWGLVAATVGMIIRSIQERSGLVGRIVMAIVGVVWSLATFFMVPVLVLEDHGVGESFKKSWGTFKATWGETVVGNLGLGLMSFLMMLPVILIAIFLATQEFMVAAVIVGVVGIALLSIFFSALQGVWVASLYRYATVGETPSGFDADLFAAAFRQKKKKDRS